MSTYTVQNAALRQGRGESGCWLNESIRNLLSSIGTFPFNNPGADTTRFGGKRHDYPEEVFVVTGRLDDEAFKMWLEAGHYASRPPGEMHGPFRTDIGCVVLEFSFPNRKRQLGS